jgi:hypothetical protein
MECLEIDGLPPKITFSAIFIQQASWSVELMCTAILYPYIHCSLFF